MTRAALIFAISFVVMYVGIKVWREFNYFKPLPRIAVLTYSVVYATIATAALLIIVLLA